MVESHYDLVCSAKFNDVEVKKFKSRVSCLTLFMAKTDGPMVDGLFCIPTKPYDNTGSAHALEHMIFLGSTKQKYQRIIEKMATLCLTTLRNATTNSDHTYFELQSGSSKGFLKMTPLLLNHILFPTLSDTDYNMEVHHANENDEDSGVMFNEQKSKEDDVLAKMDYEMRKMVDTKSSFQFNAGGFIKDIRKSSIKEVRDFHKKYYHIQNMCIIIIGNIDEKNIINTLSEYELAYPEKNIPKPHKLFEDRVLKLTKTHVKELTKGEKVTIIMTWIGPEKKDLKLLLAMKVIIHCLTRSRSTIATQCLCIEFDAKITEDEIVLCTLTFTNVPKNGVKFIKNSFKAKCVHTLKLNSFQNSINEIIMLDKLKFEENPSNEIYELIIKEFLHGIDDDDHSSFKARMSQNTVLEKLLNEKIQFWKDCLNKYIGESYIKIIAPVSNKENKSSHVKSKTRKHESSIANNQNIENPPMEFFEEYCESLPNDFGFHNINSYIKTPEGTPNKLRNLKECNFQLDDNKSSSIKIYLCFDIQTLSHDLIPYIPLYLKMKENVSKGDICSDFYLGINGHKYFAGQFSSTIMVESEVAMKEFQNKVEWFKNLLNNNIALENVPGVLKFMSNEIDKIFDTDEILNGLITMKLFKTDSVKKETSLFRQREFINRIKQSLDKTKVNLERIKCYLKCSKRYIHMATDIDKLEDGLEDKSIEKVWNDHFESNVEGVQKWNPKKNIDFVEVISDKYSSIAKLKNKSILRIIANCKCDRTSRDASALLIFLEMCSSEEGHLHQAIRGQGLAYHFRLYVDFNDGTITFHIDRSSDLYRTCNDSLNVIGQILNNEIQIPELDCKRGKQVIILNMLRSVRTPRGASMTAFHCFMNGIPFDSYKERIKEIDQMSFGEVLDAGRTYVKPLLDPLTSATFVVCDEDKVARLRAQFKNKSS